MRAVVGMSCMRPSAPFGEMAMRLKDDSALMTAFTSAYSRS
jgi:hypothetical protein